MKHRHVRSIAAVAACLLSAVRATSLADVVLDEEQRASLGIETATVAAAEAPERWLVTAQVLDPTPLISLLQDLRGAAAASHASRSELERSTRLHAADSNVSAKALEGAQAQAVSDAGRVDALRAQLLATWGRPLADMNDTARARLVEDVLAGRATLVRAELTTTLPAGVLPRFARVSTPEGGPSWDAQVLGPAAMASGQTSGEAYLLRIDAALQQGQLLTGELHDDSRVLRGIAVPRSAIIRWQGSAWVYVEQPEGTFTRRILRSCVWLDDACLVAEGVSAGDRVVTVGAELLLGAEGAADGGD